MCMKSCPTHAICYQYGFGDLSKAKEISVWAAGYYPVQQKLNSRSEVVIMMTPEGQYKYNESVVLPFREEGDTRLSNSTSATNDNEKGLNKGERKYAARIGFVAALIPCS